MSTPYCQDCGRLHRGNYVNCTQCTRLLCDNCDIRLFDIETGDVLQEIEMDEPRCQFCRTVWAAAQINKTLDVEL